MIDLESANLGDEITLSPSVLTFTPGNWDTPQTVTVTGVDDSVDRSDTAQITVKVNDTGSDADFQNAGDESVDVTLTDDDTFGITLTETGGETTVSEDGEDDIVEVVLNSEPEQEVTLSINPGTELDLGVGAGVGTSLIFTPTNWNQTQTLPITAVDDARVEGSHTDTLAYTVSSADSLYNSVNLDPTTVTITDNDEAGFGLSPNTLEIDEDGGTDQFTAVLDRAPLGNVVLSVTSGAEVNVNTTRLTFTPGNWDTPQTVVVTGVDDDIDRDDTEQVTLSVVPEDTVAEFDNLDPQNVAVTLTDDDTANIFVDPTAITTSEDGTNASFTARLTSRPTGPVAVTWTGSDETEAVLNAATLEFDETNWSTPQILSVAGVDDEFADGDQDYTVTVSTVSAATDAKYAALPNSQTPEVAGTNTDDDEVGLVVTNQEDLRVSEDGATDTVEIRLRSRPTSDVTVDLDGAGQLTLDSIQLIFAPEDWDTPQTVVLGAVDDFVAEGEQVVNLTGTATSSDAGYDGLNLPQTPVTITDNDSEGWRVNEGVDRETRVQEGGATDEIRYALNSIPSGPVSVSVDPGDELDLGAGAGVPVVLEYGVADWNVEQGITVQAVDDNFIEGDHGDTLTYSFTSSDTGYDGLVVPATNVTIEDNDTAGFTITPVADERLGEADTSVGGYTVTLTARPRSDVVLNVISGDPSSLRVDSSPLTFTSANWDEGQTVFFSGVEDDNVTDEEITVSFQINDAASDPDFNMVPGQTRILTVEDNDTASLVVTPLNLTVAERGGTETFTVALGAQPSGIVTVTLASSDSNEAMVGPNQLTFSSANWNQPQSVVVTGVDDNRVGDDTALINVTVSAAESSDDFDLAPAQTVEITLTNEDTVGVIVTPVDSTLAEPSDDGSFEIVLASRPQADVIIPLTSSDPSEGTVPASVTFTPENWNTIQTVIVSVNDDDSADSIEVFTIVTGDVTSADPDYAAITGEQIDDLEMTTQNDDPPGVVVSTDRVDTSEDGTAVTVTLKLLSRPEDGDVTIPVSLSDASEAALDRSSVTISNAEWNTGETVIVTGLNDDVADGDVIYTLEVGDPSSSNAVYDALDATDTADVTLTNRDNDTAGVTLSEPDDTTLVGEAGLSDTLEYVLTSEPTGTVTITLTPDGQLDLGNGAGSATTLEFDAGNWADTQTVTVTARDDEIEEGLHTGIVTHRVTSPDNNYNDFALPAITVDINDNDTAGLSIVESSDETTVTEGGAGDTYELILTSQPSANVRVTITPDNQLSLGDGDGVAVTKTFTPSNWNVSQTVAVEAVDDAVAEEMHTGLLTHSVTSSDLFYDDLENQELTVEITDNDTAGVYVGPATLEVSEDGTDAVYTLRLTSQPDAEVTVTLTPDSELNLGAGEAQAQTLTFDAGNWNAAQTIVITAVDDDEFEGEHAGRITRTITSTDARYESLTLADTAVTITDNDTAGVNLEVLDTTTDETGETAQVNVSLLSRPNSAVTIQLSSSDLSEGTGPESIVVAPENWNEPTRNQIIVTGVDDTLLDGPITYQLVTGSVTSPDPVYDAVTRTDVPDPTLTNADDDIDTDGDLVSDAQETLDNTDPNDGREYLDTDGDLVPDVVETEQGSDPGNAASYLDTDGGSAPDYVETVLYPNTGLPATNPNQGSDDERDTDGDGVPDYRELLAGTDAQDPDSYEDTDGDLVPDYVETRQGSDGSDANSYLDTDGDLVPDYVEGRDGNDASDAVDFADQDGDLVPDYVERGEGSDAGNSEEFSDTDNGGVPDYVELIYFPNAGLPGTDRNTATDDVRDTDQDGVPDYIELQEGTDPEDTDSYLDTDGDGVPDAVERDEGSDPNDAGDYRDTDQDEVPDYVESRTGSDTQAGLDYIDSDGDLVPDYVEVREGTDPNDANDVLDTDNGGVPDYVERSYFENTGINPTDPNTPADDTQDSDGDGVPDYIELTQGTDWQDDRDYRDTDGDLVPDYVEEQAGTDPNNPLAYIDTDEDGVPDYVEERDGTDANDASNYLDNDLGGAPNYIETVLFPNAGLPSTDKQDDADDARDTDGDGVPDYVELRQSTDPLERTSYRDSDGDEVPDYVEGTDGTDPNNRGDYRDTDEDLVPDYVEDREGSDPTNGLDYLDTDKDYTPDYVERVLENTDPNDEDDFLDTDGGGVSDYVETVWIPRNGLPGLDPNDANDDGRDTDGDEVPDIVELVNGTDPEDANSYRDSDGDSVPDYVEAREGTDPNNTVDYPDTDQDRVPDYVEERDGTDPSDASDYRDGDNDLVPDYVETNLESTDAGDAGDYLDSDGGGVSDYVETTLLVNNGLPAGDASDPADDAQDTDGDLVPDIVELGAGTDPNDRSDYPDSDGDLVPDYIESDNGDGTTYVDTDNDGVPDYVEGRDGTDPEDETDFFDKDGGGAPDYIEQVLFPNSGLPATNPEDASDDLQDTDRDGVPDYLELQAGTNAQDATSYPDTDGDKVPDYVENQNGTNPEDPGDYQDTDGDLVPDYVEFREGSDETDPNDYADTDGDLVPDYVEQVIEGTNSEESGDYRDSDGGGVGDYVETVLLPNNNGTGGNLNDPNDDAVDTDGDGVPDSVEFIQGTALDDADDYLDTDGDLVPDYVESREGSDVNDPLAYADADQDSVPDYVENRDGTDPEDGTDYLDGDGGRASDYAETVLFPNAGLNPTDAADRGDDDQDTDGDGVPDYLELRDGTDPLDEASYADADGDLVPDYVEENQNTDPNDGTDYPDADGDLVPDYIENRDGTNPDDADDFVDTDAGGAPDYVERTLHPLLPLPATDVNDPGDDLRDTDGDGVPDYIELQEGTDFADEDDYLDSDADGVPDYVEAQDGTDLNVQTDYRDSDGDLVPDYIELREGTDPDDALDYRDTDGDIVPDYVETVLENTDPQNQRDYLDTDGGGAGDYLETVYLPNRGLNGTDLNDADDDAQDSDGDTVPDYIEVLNRTGLRDIEDDGDGTSTAEEYAGPNNGDANGDGIPDYAQRSVATRVSPVSNGYTSLEVTGECELIRAFEIIQESSLERQDTAAEYFVGLHDFELECGNLADSVDVAVYWDRLYDTDNWIYKKYNARTNEYSFIDDRVRLETVSIAGTAKTVSRYVLRDGGDLDTDGETNARIIDPAGPALIAVFAGQEDQDLVRTGGYTSTLPYLLALASGLAWLAWIGARQRVLQERKKAR